MSQKLFFPFVLCCQGWKTIQSDYEFWSRHIVIGWFYNLSNVVLPLDKYLNFLKLRKASKILWNCLWNKCFTVICTWIVRFELKWPLMTGKFHVWDKKKKKNGCCSSFQVHFNYKLSMLHKVVIKEGIGELRFYFISKGVWVINILNSSTLPRVHTFKWATFKPLMLRMSSIRWVR